MKKPVSDLEKMTEAETSRFADDEFTRVLPAILPYTMVPQERLYSLFKLDEAFVNGT